MFGKALIIELFLAIVLYIIYKIFFSLNSEKRRIARIQKEIQKEQEKEEKREAHIQETIQKNMQTFEMLAKVSYLKKEKSIMEYLSKVDLSHELNYDFDSKELTLQEQKAFYEEQIEKIKDIRTNILPSVTRLPALLMKLYKWHTFCSDYSVHLFDIIKNSGFDFVQEAQKIYKDSIVFKNEFEKITNEVDKKYHIVCTAEDRRKKLGKELDRLKKEAIQLSNVKFSGESFNISFDNIVVSENGMFCLTIKYLDRERIEKIYITEDEKWTGQLDNGDRYYIEPVAPQFFNNMQQFQKLINQKLKEKHGTDAPYIRAYPIVIVAEENIMISNESELPVQKLPNVFNHIQLFKGGKIPIEYLQHIKEILSEINIEDKTEEVEDSISVIEKNAQKLSNIFRIADLIQDSVADYCISIEEKKIIKAYRQLIALDHLLKYRKSVEDAHIIHKRRNIVQDPNVIQPPDRPLIPRLKDPCMRYPIKILSQLLDLSILKMEFVLKDIYSEEDLKKMPAISFQYINRAMVEIIKSIIPDEAIKPFIEIEAYNNLTLYRVKYFDPALLK